MQSTKLKESSLNSLQTATHKGEAAARALAEAAFNTASWRSGEGTLLLTDSFKHTSEFINPYSSFNESEPCAAEATRSAAESAVRDIASPNNQ